MEDFLIRVSGEEEVCECLRVLNREGWGMGRDVEEVCSSIRSFFQTSTRSEGHTVCIRVNPRARKLEGVRSSWAMRMSSHLATYDYTAFLQDVLHYNDY